jgi:hypothetical protein
MARRIVVAAGDRRRIMATGRSSGRGGVAWRAQKSTRGGKLGRQMAWRRRVDAIRVNNGTGGAAAAMSYGGDGKELLVWQNQPELYRLKYASPFQRLQRASNGIIPW